jgi:hypothetical protein
MSLIRSGTWEPAQGSSQWLQYEDDVESRRKSEESEKELVVEVKEQRPSVLSSNFVSNCLSSQYLSEVESSLLQSVNPLKLDEVDAEEITVLGNRGLWTNRQEVLKFKGDLNEYLINQDENPQVINKKVEKSIEYIQELAIRYLKPPVQPAPGEIIIKHDPNVLPPPAPPLVLRQQPARPITPEPLIVRESPPEAPQPVGQKIITILGKRLPPPPRKVIVERLAQLPSKPQSIITERWLPYQQMKRRVIYQAAQPDPVYCKPRNVIIQWEAPDVLIIIYYIYIIIIFNIIFINYYY